MTKYIKHYHRVDPQLTSTLTLEEIIMHNDEPLMLTGICSAVDANKRLRTAIRNRFGKGGDSDDGKRVEQIVRTLYPLYVITDWNAVDAEGNAVPYDAHECANILADMEPFAIGDIINHFTNPANFRERLTAADGAAKGN